LLGSTETDYRKHKKSYDAWYEHVHLD
jgi:hypothetical protein